MQRRTFIAVSGAVGAGLAQARTGQSPQAINFSALPKEIWKWDATSTVAAIRAGHISSKDTVKASLSRVNALNGAANALVQIFEAEALQAADAADNARRRSAGATGALHGLPLTIKDNTDQRGKRTVNGMKNSNAQPSPEDSPVVHNLRSAGAIILGRTNTPCLSSRWETDNTAYGRTVNPWSPTRTPGGSTGGGGAAVAHGMGAIAHGNDIGGSIRYPAFCCGVTGIRPTSGRVPMFNPTAGAERSLCNQLFNVEGALARSVRDLRLVLPVLSQGSARDPLWTPTPAPVALPRALKVGLIKSSPGLFVHPSIAGAIDEAGQRLRAAGFLVEEIAPPPIAETVALWAKMVFAELREAMPGFSSVADADAVRANQLFLEVTAPISGKQYMDGIGEILAMRRRWAQFLERYPVLVGPNSGELAFEHGFDVKGADATRHQIAAQALMVTVNLLGLPAVAVPTGRVAAADAPKGLPVGVQVISRRFGDEWALQVAQEIQQRGSAMATWA